MSERQAQIQFFFFKVLYFIVYKFDLNCCSCVVYSVFARSSSIAPSHLIFIFGVVVISMRRVKLITLLSFGSCHEWSDVPGVFTLNRYM